MKKVILHILIIIVPLIILSTAVHAEVSTEKVFKPLDLVVVVDSSGSMVTSDPKKTATAAVRMLTNMLPARDSRVGIISFNTKAEVKTLGKDGTPSLYDFSNLTNIQYIRNSIDSIRYEGGTGIGNALMAAVELLEKEMDPKRTKSILLFTDGCNSFGPNKDKEAAECDENEVEAIRWAMENDCAIYCLGYDYRTSNGTSSMGENGEGLLKLSNIAESTGGKVSTIYSASEIEDELIRFIGDIFQVYLSENTFEDGKCIISIEPNVIELNIRISDEDTEALQNAVVHLTDPRGREVDLENAEQVRYDTDRTAKSIKILFPEAGDWVFELENIPTENVHVWSMKHFEMNMKASLTFPAENPEGIAFTNDDVEIRAWLTKNGTDLEDDELYGTVTSATATFASRLNPNDVQTVTLNRDGNSFVGTFRVPQDAFYDVTVRLEWNSAFREDSSLVIRSSNRPLEIVESMEDLRLYKGKVLEVPDLLGFIHDDEGDKINVSVKRNTEPSAADIEIEGDTLRITGKKHSSTYLTLTFRDAQGNEKEMSFKVTVIDIWVVLGVGGLILVLLAVVIIVAVSIYLSMRRVRGYVIIKSIETGTLRNGDAGIFSSGKTLYRRGAVAPAAETASNADPFAADPFVEDPFATAIAPDAEDEEEDEETISANYREALNLSRLKKWKVPMDWLLNTFMRQYTEHMTGFGARESQKVQTVSEALNNDVLSVFRGLLLKGTGGKCARGLELVVTGDMLRKGRVIIQDPIIAKKKGQLSDIRKPQRILISVPQGEADPSGNRSAVRIEMSYTKK